MPDRRQRYGRVVRIGACCLTAVLLFGAGASAQDLRPEDRETARGHFDRGTLAFERGDYGEAAAEFRAAYALTEHPDLLYNIYTAQERNGQLEEAAEALEGYLRDGSPEDDRRAALELRLERLRLRIEQARLQQAQADAEAERERAAAAQQLEAARAERAAAEAAAARERVDRLEQAQAGHATADALTISGVIVLGLGGAGLATFGVFAGLSAAEDSDLASRCGRDAGVLCRQSEVEALQTYNTVADATLIAGGGLVVVGGALLLIGVATRPSGGGASQAWFVAPVAGPSLTGVVAGGEF